MKPYISKGFKYAVILIGKYVWGVFLIILVNVSSTGVALAPDNEVTIPGPYNNPSASADVKVTATPDYHPIEY